jgi:hypothetical protein
MVKTQASVLLLPLPITPSLHDSNTTILLYFCFVNVTPAPVLARFEGLDDRVAGCVKMFSGVPIG